MGMRVRLKACFNTAGYHGQALAILKALKTYGMILADNGSNWYISGTPGPAPGQTTTSTSSSASPAPPSKSSPPAP